MSRHWTNDVFKGSNIKLFNMLYFKLLYFRRFIVTFYYNFVKNEISSEASKKKRKCSILGITIIGPWLILTQIAFIKAKKKIVWGGETSVISV